jgi:large repetitive protein
MANTYKALSTVTVGAGGAVSISFTNIPQTYTDLVLVTSLRSATSGVASSTFFNINSMGGLGYGVTGLQGSGSSITTGTTTYAVAGQINGGATTANTFSNVSYYFPNYTNNTINKTFITDSVLENNSAASAANAIDWQTSTVNTTDPITSITISDGSSGLNLVQHSTATLYGIFNADVSSAPSTPTIGTATDAGTSGQVSVAFTPVSNAASYAVTSNPGSLVATGSLSPVTVSGLTNGTSYTFTCVSSNPFGSSAASAASNSATPTAGYSSIATVSYPSGTGGDVVFTNIPSIYRTLQIRMFSRHTRVDNSSTWFMTFNEDGSTTYSYQGAEQTGSGSISGVNELNQTRIQGPTSAANTGASRFGSAVINIFDANQTNKFKSISYQSGFSNNNNGGARLWTAVGTWRSTSAINTIRIAPNSGFAQFSHIALYGIG